MCPANRRDSSGPAIDKAGKTWSTCTGGRRVSLKRKPRKVLYPRLVKKYLPREEKDTARKWLVILGAIVLFQIYCEDATECDVELTGTTIVPLETRPPSAKLLKEMSSQRSSNVSILFFMTVDPEKLNAVFSEGTSRERDHKSLQ